ncbi:MAG: transcriptional repressor [Cyclobacteriaceae bacterium]|jgi:Fur family ferric uptake transcriptional regulator|nr:MAG: transcriptional repressor [Cyclobacteriaceae bacterium]
MNGSPQLLKEFKLRSTPSRKAILNFFLKKNYALAHADIEKGIPSHFDRVTVYRTLKTFLDKGLIHKVLDDEGALKYALCTEACTMTGHHHDHVHFKCVRCGQTNCLDTEVPPVKLPKGYLPGEINLLIQGVCAKCS